MVFTHTIDGHALFDTFFKTARLASITSDHIDYTVVFVIAKIAFVFTKRSLVEALNVVFVCLFIYKHELVNQIKNK